eukprot:10114857-Lingulodinium_polyedra.AAC.1
MEEGIGPRQWSGHGQYAARPPLGPEEVGCPLRTCQVGPGPGPQVLAGVFFAPARCRAFRCGHGRGQVQWQGDALLC